MKNNFQISLITKKQSEALLLTHHYLKDISRGFKSGYNFGLFKEDKVVGVCIFTGFPVPELSKGMLGLPREQQDGLFELSRLCLEPTVQETEHNLASWFVSRCIKQLCKLTKVRIILSYADSEFHNGIVYKACNFKYYGTTDSKKDFWIKQEDGTFKKHSRGKIKGLEGEWRDRTIKHRYVYQIDKSISILWKQKCE
jgi:hypothetical protein